jgi:hypothetical protein
MQAHTDAGGTSCSVAPARSHLHAKARGCRSLFSRLIPFLFCATAPPDGVDESLAGYLETISRMECETCDPEVLNSYIVICFID